MNCCIILGCAQLGRQPRPTCSALNEMVKPGTGVNTSYFDLCQAQTSDTQMCDAFGCVVNGPSQKHILEGIGMVIDPCGNSTVTLTTNLIVGGQPISERYSGNVSIPVPGENNTFVNITIVQKDSGIIFAVS